ncbi:CDGSH iron-sulfur domain-containing protein [Anaerorudis cellulosivorans]|jgi:CDGSH-type Zn-finger protein|uniref:CDGSH iron-sulfur domain-containing protein n=1 Tax=Anaerorudis cellulosivorans TaxID=3397862 RepID=UPI00221EA306|nr:CDGSH iron-sulfur domain-containing protein [Seramator thermalis]MCW1736110.1 CDGSH iron-sulfur domain-containing protein [Seramator thermalis]
MSVVEIKMIPNGPLEMKGDFKIIRPDGKEEEKSGTIHLCRCGHSNKKPYCDGSHVKAGFKD